jgi:uncharacterized protein YndB with AHSA1/START domain
MTESVQRDVYIPHAPEAVWQALTDSNALAEWLMPNDFQPRVGHKFTFQLPANPQAAWDGKISCEVTEVSEPSRLAYSWVGGGIDTQVTYRLEREGDGTRLFLEQAGFDTANPQMAYAYQHAGPGWDRMLAKLPDVIGSRAASR